MENDRLSYSFGMKVNLGNYQSSDFHVSLSSDVAGDENSAQAFARIKKEVEIYAELAFQQIKNSQTGLTNETKAEQSQVQSGNTQDVPAPAEQKSKTKTDIKVYRQQIKAAFGVLQAQKKITAEAFKAKYLSNKKTDDLNELEVTKALVGLREDFKELGL